MGRPSRYIFQAPRRQFSSSSTGAPLRAQGTTGTAKSGTAKRQSSQADGGFHRTRRRRQVSHYLGIFSDITEKIRQARIRPCRTTCPPAACCAPALPANLRPGLIRAQHQQQVALLCIDIGPLQGRSATPSASAFDLLRSVASGCAITPRYRHPLSARMGTGSSSLGAMKDDEAATRWPTR